MNIISNTHEAIISRNTLLEKEKVIDNIDNLKKELLQFLRFDELTPETLHGLINQIDVKADGVPLSIIASMPQNLNRSRLFPYREPASSFKTICDTTSTCVVIGNISTGCTSTVLYPPSSKIRRSLARVPGLHETYTTFFGFISIMVCNSVSSQPLRGGSTINTSERTNGQVH